MSFKATNAYQRIHTETSLKGVDQHQIVTLLYEGVLRYIANARGALERGDVAAKCKGIGNAIRVIEEGLSTGLDREAGGDIAVNLSELYDYCTRRLMHANARNDDAALQEVATLIETVAESWKQIRPVTQTNPKQGH